MSQYWTTQSTQEGGNTFKHSGDRNVEFFSKAGSMFEKTRPFYGRREEVDILKLYKESWVENRIIAFKLMLWLRDCRGGAGNRSGFRQVLNWMAIENPVWVSANLHWVPVVGRWDDLRALFGTPLEKEAAEMWAYELKKGNVLAAKWCDRSDRPVRLVMGMKIGDFRRFLANLRKEQIVEHKMCSNDWSKIAYETVPSVAMARYTKAFAKNDADRFSQFKESVVRGEKTVNASVLFPHDCVRTSRFGDAEMADAQFEALPNFMEDGDYTMVISDTSGSMDKIVGGQVRAVDISQGMALYCSAKMPEDSPFYKRFIAFCSEGEFKDWRGQTFSQAVRNRRIFNGAIGSTRIDKALETILEIAQINDIPQRLMPKTLLIVSDMQFHQGGVEGSGTEVQKALTKWDLAGYEKPKIVYWNTDGYAGSPETADAFGAGLVSGFSPSVLGAVFKGDDFTPRGIMLRALEKYEICVPE
jgi:hypothetical protein